VGSEYQDRPSSSYGMPGARAFLGDRSGRAGHFEALSGVTAADAPALPARQGSSRGLWDGAGGGAAAGLERQLSGTPTTRGVTPSSPSSTQRGLPPRPRSGQRSEVASRGREGQTVLRAPSPAGPAGWGEKGDASPPGAGPPARPGSASGGPWPRGRGGSAGLPGGGLLLDEGGARATTPNETGDAVAVDTQPWGEVQVEGWGGASGGAGAWAEEVGAQLREVWREVGGADSKEELLRVLTALRAIGALLERAAAGPDWEGWVAAPAPPGAGAPGSAPAASIREAVEEAAGSVMNLQHPAVLARAASLALRVGGDGQRLLGAARVLFRLSKDAGCDGYFRSEGALAPLLGLLDRETRRFEQGPWAEALTLAAGALKNVSQEPAVQRALCAAGALGSAGRALVGIAGRAEVAGGGAAQARGAQVAVQVAGMLRNLSLVSSHAREFPPSGALAGVLAVAEAFPAHRELMGNVARVLSKLSMVPECQDEIASSVSSLDAMVRLLEEHPEERALSARVAFALANVTTHSPASRDALSAVPRVLSRVAALLSRLAAGPGAERSAEVLIRVMRLTANMAIHPDMGRGLSRDAGVAGAVLRALQDPALAGNDELALNTVGALTNLTFYGDDGGGGGGGGGDGGAGAGGGNHLLRLDPGECLPLLTPMLLSSNPEAVCEATRALGNLSRRPEVRLWMLRARLVEALCLLLDHPSLAVLRAVCGVLVNLAADPATHAAVLEHEGAPLLVDAMERALSPGEGDGPGPDPEVAGLAAKALANLLAQGGGGAGLAAGDVESALESLGALRDGGDAALCARLEGLLLEAELAPEGPSDSDGGGDGDGGGGGDGAGGEELEPLPEG